MSLLIMSVIQRKFEQLKINSIAFLGFSLLVNKLFVKTWSPKVNNVKGFEEGEE